MLSGEREAYRGGVAGSSERDGECVVSSGYVSDSSVGDGCVGKSESNEVALYGLVTVGQGYAAPW